MVSLSSPGGALEIDLLPEYGARLHRLRYRGADLLRTPHDIELHQRQPFTWGSYVMAPWCNRIAVAPVRVGSRLVELGSNHSDGTALHGQVYVRPWSLRGGGAFAVRGGGDGWPWEYEVEQRIALDDRTVRLELALTNLSDDSMPAGLGIHPWFRRPVGVSIPARSVYETNLRPPRRPSPVAGAFDLREQSSIAAGLDATWADLERPAVELAWPELGLRATLRADGPTVHVVAANPTDIDATAVEPQTHAPDGLRRLLHGDPGALAMLAPGEVLRLGVELAFFAA